MKIAILLSGQFRNCIQCMDNMHRYLIDKYDADVFINSYYDSQPEENTEEVIERFKPVKYNVSRMPEELLNVSETHHKYPKYSETEGSVGRNIFVSWYSVKNVNLLRKEYEKETGITYDVIIKTRFDLNLLEDVPIVENYDLNIPIGYDHRDGCNDLLSFGNSDNMDKYCSLYDYLLTYLKYKPLHSEILLKNHLQKNNINVSRFYQSMMIKDNLVTDYAITEFGKLNV